MSALLKELNANETVSPLVQRACRLQLARHYAKQKDILAWGRVLFPEKFFLPYCYDLHQYFVDIRHEPQTDTEAPRNHAKTTVKCFLIPLFQALEEPDTFNFYLNVQATDPKALSINRAIKTELEENPLLKELYGDQMGERWTDEEFELANGVVFKAVGAGKSLRGIQFKNRRPDYMLIDDLYDEEDLNNPESTLKKNAWFWGTLYPARAKGRQCCVHVQGTAINPEDLLEELKKKEGWKCKTFKAILDWDAKVVLWKELNTFASLMVDLANMGSVIFYRELMNERRDETSAIVKRSWLKDWEYDPDVELKIDRHHIIVGVLLGCDPSIGKKVENDFTGVALVFKTGFDDGRGNLYWIHDVREEKLSLDSRVQLLQGMADGMVDPWRITQCNLEAIAGFNDFCDEVIRRTNLPVKRIAEVKDKITNLENKSHYFENKKIRINKNIPSAIKDKLVHQLTNNHPKHDDLRDAVLLCLDDNSGLWGFVE